MKATLLILAAGMGSRYGGLKQMDPVGPSGETILDYSVYDAMRAGFGKVIFVMRKEFHRIFHEKLGSRFEKDIEVGYVFQELNVLPEGYVVPAGREKPWGTGHAVLCAEAAVDSPFVVINADDFYGSDAFSSMAEFLSNESEDYAMAGFRLKHTLTEHGSVSRGVCKVTPDGFLDGVEELTMIEKTEKGASNADPDCPRELSGEEAVSMNFWGFRPSLFAHAGEQFREFLDGRGAELKSEFYIPFVVDRLIREGKVRVKVIDTDSRWFGVTYKEDRPVVMAALKERVEAGEYPEKLWQ